MNDETTPNTPETAPATEPVEIDHSTKLMARANVCAALIGVYGSARPRVELEAEAVAIVERLTPTQEVSSASPQ